MIGLLLHVRVWKQHYVEDTVMFRIRFRIVEPPSWNWPFCLNPRTSTAAVMNVMCVTKRKVTTCKMCFWWITGFSHFLSSGQEWKAHLWVCRCMSVQWLCVTTVLVMQEEQCCFKGLCTACVRACVMGCVSRVWQCGQQKMRGRTGLACAIDIESPCRRALPPQSEAAALSGRLETDRVIHTVREKTSLLWFFLK